MGKTNININAPVSAAIVNIGASLTNTTQTVRTIGRANPEERERLAELLCQLASMLEKVGEEHANVANTIAAQAKILIDAANAERPNSTFINLTREGLLEAAKALAEIAPWITLTVKEIGDIIGLTTGR